MIQFPTNLDNFANPNSTSTLGNPSHSQQHSDTNDAIEALQLKVGVTNSTDVNSLDYKVAHVGAGTDHALLSHLAYADAGHTGFQSALNGTGFVKASGTTISYDNSTYLTSVEGTAVKSTGEAGGTKFLREDGDGTCSWQTPTGSGDVVGPASAVDGNIALFNTTTGKLIKDGGTGLGALNGATITVASNNDNATYYPLFVTSATGSLEAKSDSGYTYNPLNGILTSTYFSGVASGSRCQSNYGQDSGQIIWGTTTVGTTNTISRNIVNGTGAALTIDLTQSANATDKILDVQSGSSTKASVLKDGTITTLGTIELGHASDTTIARVSAGVASIEGNNIITTNKQVTDLSATASGDKDKYLHSNSSTGALEWTTISNSSALSWTLVENLTFNNESSKTTTSINAGDLIRICINVYNGSTGNNYIRMTINNDSGSNYSYRGFNSVNTGDTQTGATFVYLNSSWNAGVAQVGEMIFNRVLINGMVNGYGVSGGYGYNTNYFLYSAAANVTRLDFNCATGIYGNIRIYKASY